MWSNSTQTLRHRECPGKRLTAVPAKVTTQALRGTETSGPIGNPGRSFAVFINLKYVRANTDGEAGNKYRCWCAFVGALLARGVDITLRVVKGAQFWISVSRVSLITTWLCHWQQSCTLVEPTAFGGDGFSRGRDVYFGHHARVMKRHAARRRPETKEAKPWAWIKPCSFHPDTRRPGRPTARRTRVGAMHD